MNKLVSVIIPCFNGNETIGDAIKSIERQNYGNIEVVVVDDFSSTPLQLKDLVSNTRHIVKLIRNSKNIGANYSINEGFDVAAGDYICILAADDELPATSIRLRAQELDNNYDLVFGATEKIYKGRSEIIKNLDVKNKKSVVEWFKQKPKLTGINNASAMYTAALRKAAGYRLNRGAKGSHEDYEYVLRLLFHSKNPTSIDQVCYKYFLEDDGTMNNEIRKNKNAWVQSLIELETLYLKKFESIYI